MSEEKTEAEHREVLLTHLLPPKGYEIDLAEWRRVLKHDAESFGCDWLEWFMRSQGGNVVSGAVQDLAERQAQLVAVARAAKAYREFRKQGRRFCDANPESGILLAGNLDAALSALAPDVLTEDDGK